MKIANQYVYSDDQDYLARLAEEFGMMGRSYRLEHGKLIVYSRSRKSRKGPQKRKR